jgi:hypothetical protein
MNFGFESWNIDAMQHVFWTQMMKPVVKMNNSILE